MQEIEKLQKRLKTAKTSILIVAVFTIVNTVLIAANEDLSFLFSAYIPQLVAAIFAEIASEEHVPKLLWIGVAIAVVMSLVYLLLWVGSRKKDAFITVALVLFCIDTALFLVDIIAYIDASYVIAVVFHAWVIYDLIMGVSAYKKLKKLSVQEGLDKATFGGEIDQNMAYTNPNAQNDNYNPYYAQPVNDYMQPQSVYNPPVRADSTPIRLSENKGRVIISAEYNGMNVEVRRSKGLTELIVDGKVYAEKTGIIETEYTLSARVSGVEFTTSMTMTGMMFLFADGKQIAKKLRLM